MEATQEGEAREYPLALERVKWRKSNILLLGSGLQKKKVNSEEYKILQIFKYVYMQILENLKVK